MGDAVVIRNGVLLGERGLVEGCDLLIEGGRISAIGPALHLPGATIIDATDHLVAPGLVDLHIHGAAGALFEDADPDAVAVISDALPRYGTTSLLATIAALPPDRLRAAVEAIARGSRAAAGTRILGIHLEGPFLNPQRAGAQRADWMRAPSLDEIDALQRASGGLIRLVTLAPEIPGALEVIGTLRARGIAVALGHSAADVDTVSRAVDAGATHVTHLFNAMGTLHQRAPGLIGAALTDDRLSVELICDGEHVHRQAVDVAVRCKPPGTIVLVSDAVAACSARRGDIELFGTVCVAGDAVRVKATGQLAGSCLTLDAALRRMRAWFPALPPVRCVGMATAAPAAVIGTTDAGILAPGRMADVVVLTQELEVAATLCGGRIAYRRG